MKKAIVLKNTTYSWNCPVCMFLNRIYSIQKEDNCSWCGENVQLKKVKKTSKVVKTPKNTKEQTKKNQDIVTLWFLAPKI